MKKRLIRFMEAKASYIRKKCKLPKEVYFNKRDRELIESWDEEECAMLWEKIEWEIRWKKSGLGGWYCPFCMRYIICDECLYGKEHGYCSQADSDFRKVRDRMNVFIYPTDRFYKRFLNKEILVEKIASFMEAKAKLIEKHLGVPSELYWKDEDEEKLYSFGIKELRKGIKELIKGARKAYSSGKVLHLAATCFYCKITKCSVCPYGQVHKICSDRESDFKEITDALSSLPKELQDVLYREHKELFEKTFLLELRKEG